VTIRPEPDTTIACVLAGLFGLSSVALASQAGDVLLGDSSTTLWGALVVPLPIVVVIGLLLSLRAKDKRRSLVLVAIEAGALFAGSVLVGRTLVAALPGTALAALLTGGLASLIGPHWAEQWWRRPLDALPKPSAGEVWWADVPFEESWGSKDRPCLVLSGSRRRRKVLMFTSQDKSDRRGYIAVPDTTWRRSNGHRSWLKTDRVITLRVERFRRVEGPAAASTLEQVRGLLGRRRVRF
jgi:hypothetical protein